MVYQNILYQIQDGIGVITLNRPESHNALCRAVNEELEAALNQIAREPTVRVLILTGGSKVFAAGADIKEMLEASPLKAEITSAQAHQINNRLEDLPIPVIGAINGMALGGGCELALACDFRIVGENAVFGLPEVGLGIMPGAGGTQRLARLIGVTRAKAVVMLGKTVKGKEAYEIGIATKVVPDGQVMEETLALARKLKEKPAAALMLAKMAFSWGDRFGLETGKGMEKLLFALAFSTADQKEGMSAFMERRPPAYTHDR